MAVSPLVVFLYDASFLSSSAADALRSRKLLYAGLACTWLVLALQVVTNPRGMSLELRSGFLPQHYLAIQAGAIVHYLRLLLIPSGLTFDYGEAGCAVPLAHFADWGLPAAFLLAMIGLGLWGWRRRTAAGFLTTTFFVLLAPSSSVVPISTEVISEHRLYLPSAAALVLLVLGIDRMIGRRHALAAAIAGIAVLSLALLTFRRNQDYRSATALWEDTVRKRPQNTRAWWLLGSAYLSEGDGARGSQTWVKALQVGAEACEVDSDRRAHARADDDGRGGVEPFDEGGGVRGVLGDRAHRGPSRPAVAAPVVRDHTARGSQLFGELSPRRGGRT